VLSYDVKTIQGKEVNGCDHAEMAKCVVAGVEYKEGGKAPLSCKAYSNFNHRLRSKAFGPILREVVARDAAVTGDTTLLEKTLHGESTAAGGLALTSASLHGLLGETALHIAAACGHIKAMKLLIDEKSNPNQQDNDGETPLHYAAMAGQVKAARFLLNNSALPTVESYFMETASIVAADNVAFFLGIDTSGVLQVMESGEDRAPNGVGLQACLNSDMDSDSEQQLHHGCHSDCRGCRTS